MKNDNRGDDMVDIMAHLHQYVPVLEYSESVCVPNSDESVDMLKAVFHNIFIGGDQLTAARARGAKKVMANSVSPHVRLDGLNPCAEDWHTRLNLLDVRTIIIIPAMICIHVTYNYVLNA